MFEIGYELRVSQRGVVGIAARLRDGHFGIRIPVEAR
jgi:hypothetical protein